MQAKDKRQGMVAYKITCITALVFTDAEIWDYVCLYYVFIELTQSRADLVELTRSITASLCIQEQSSRREIGDLQRQLESSEALVADLRKTVQQRDSELNAVEPKVSTFSQQLYFPVDD